jgi:hypothetical protein
MTSLNEGKFLRHNNEATTLPDTTTIIIEKKEKVSPICITKFAIGH